MRKAVASFISHAKKGTAYMQTEFEKDIGCRESQLNHYLFVTAIINSDFLKVVKKSITIARIFRQHTTGPGQTDKYRTFALQYCIFRKEIH